MTIWPAGNALVTRSALLRIYHGHRRPRMIPGVQRVADAEASILPNHGLGWMSVDEKEYLGVHSAPPTRLGVPT